MSEWFWEKNQESIRSSDIKSQGGTIARLYANGKQHWKGLARA